MAMIYDSKLMAIWAKEWKAQIYKLLDDALNDSVPKYLSGNVSEPAIGGPMAGIDELIHWMLKKGEGYRFDIHDERIAFFFIDTNNRVKHIEIDNYLIHELENMKNPYIEGLPNYGRIMELKNTITCGKENNPHK